MDDEWVVPCADADCDEIHYLTENIPDAGESTLCVCGNGHHTWVDGPEI